MASAKRSAWEEWGQVDPLWAIVTEGGKEFGNWDLIDFFASGKASIDSLWSTAASNGVPTNHRIGLDFGCGVGRLTRPLGEHLDRVVGLDISPTMIELANEYNRRQSNLIFQVHQEDTLAAFPDGHFDAVCSLLVLQHLQSHEAIGNYIREFVRVLAPGGLLMMQLPESVPEVTTNPGFKARLRLRTRIAGTLHSLGVSPDLLYRALGWKPEMTMRGLAKDRVLALIDEMRATLVWSSEPSIDPSGVSNVFYLATR